MNNTAPEKWLAFETGAYSLLVSTDDVQQVLACHADFYNTTKLSHSHAAPQSALWQGTPLPYLSLRHCWQLPSAEPGHALILTDRQGTARVMLGVDRADHLVSSENTHLMPVEGFHPALDRYIDALWRDSQHGTLRLQLRSVEHWLDHAMTQTEHPAGATP